MSDCDIITLSSGEDSSRSQSPPPKSKRMIPKTRRGASKINGNTSVVRTTKKPLKRRESSEIDECKIIELEDPLVSAGNEELPASKEIEMVSEAFKGLLKACRRNDRGQRMENILEKTEKFYNNAEKEYTNSIQFHDLLVSSTDNISKKPRETFVFLKEVVDEMRFHKQKRKNGSSDVQPSKKHKGEAGSSTEAEAAGPSEKKPDESDGEDSEKARHIKRLSKMLRILHLHIQKLEEKDVDFEDDNDSAYIKLERFKERFCKVRQKICELKGDKFNTLNNGRRIMFSGTDYPEVNRCIEKFVNKTGMFPDYYDVMKLVSETSSRPGFKLSHQQQRKVATDAFLKVGDQLQKARQYETWNLMSHFLGNNTDPASNNSELETELCENRRLGKSKLQNVIDEFAEKQVQEKHEAVDVVEEEANKSISEEDDEEDESEEADGDEELDMMADEELDGVADEEDEDIMEVDQELEKEVKGDVDMEVEEGHEVGVKKDHKVCVKGDDEISVKMDLDGEVKGEDLDGEVKGEDLDGEVKGKNLDGEVKGDLDGEAKGKDVDQEVKEDLDGEVREDLDGEVKEDLDGKVKEDLDGKVKEDLDGKVKGEDLDEKVQGDLDGEVEAEPDKELITECNENVGKELNGKVVGVDSDGVDADINGDSDCSTDMEETKSKLTSELSTTRESTKDN